MDAVTLLAIALMGILVTALFILSEYILAIPLKLIASFGWGDIAIAYPGKRHPGGRPFHFCTVGINSMRYRSCVTVTVADDFVALDPMFPFRFFHPSISLPISRLERVCDSVQTFGLTEFRISGTRHAVWFTRRIALQVVAGQQQLR